MLRWANVDIEPSPRDSRRWARSGASVDQGGRGDFLICLRCSRGGLRGGNGSETLLLSGSRQRSGERAASSASCGSRPDDLASVPVHVPMVAVLAYVYHAISPWSVAVVRDAGGCRATVAAALSPAASDAQRRWAALTSGLRRANLSFATALVATLDARDRYTAGHSTAVAIYARDIARAHGTERARAGTRARVRLVHDVGKIGLPAGLLEKPGALSLEERREMERHSEIGEDILRNVDDYSEIARSSGATTSGSMARVPGSAGRKTRYLFWLESSPSRMLTTR